VEDAVLEAAHRRDALAEASRDLGTGQGMHPESVRRPARIESGPYTGRLRNPAKVRASSALRLGAGGMLPVLIDGNRLQLMTGLGCS
jgi:hypothetical protein